MNADPFPAVLAYHELHGDDYGTETSRAAKYQAVLDALARAPKVATLLDVGCGAREFERLVPHLDYTGIDLLEGVNVLTVSDRYDAVVANGIFYQLGDNAEPWMRRLMRHMWILARQVLVVTSLSAWAPVKHRGDFYADPAQTLRFCRTLSTKVVLDHSYLAHDFCVAIYR